MLNYAQVEKLEEGFMRRRGSIDLVSLFVENLQVKSLPQEIVFLLPASL